MKKYLLVLMTVLFVFSACGAVDVNKEQVSNDAVLKEVDSRLFIKDYQIKTELLPDSSFKSYLSVGDTKIAELTDDKTPQLEYSVAKVFRSSSKDIVFVIKGGGCSGCTFFLDHYYVVDKTDLSFEKVDFDGPTGIDITWKGAPDWAVYGDLTNELAYVNRIGNIEKDRSSYYEEIWIYFFDSKEWKLVETVDKGKTVSCMGLDFVLDPSKLHYWKQGMDYSPDEIPENVFDLKCGQVG